MWSLLTTSHRMPLLDRSTLVQSRLVWCFVAAAIIGLRAVWTNPDLLLSGAGGPDDAMRLVQIREFLATGDWFDTAIHQVGVPQVLISHWSRLLDAPVALLILFFGLFVSTENAELITRTIWPVALLTGLIYTTVVYTERQGGVAATVAVLILTVCSMVAASQFAPGRIDHHNVQILCAVAGTFFLIRSVNDQKFAWYAGAAFGLGLSVGLEALLLIAAIVGFTCICAAFQSTLREAAWRIQVACVGLMTVCFALSVPVSQWLVLNCDVTSLNLIFLVACIAGAMTLMRYLNPHASPSIWLAGLAAGCLVGVAGYLVAEPACAGGPLGLVNEEIKPIWLDTVSEFQNLMYLLKVLPLAAASYIVFLSVALLIAALDYRRERNAQTLITLFAVFAAAIYGCIYAKLMSYAVWIAAPTIAIWVSKLPAIDRVSRRAVCVAAALLLSQNAIAAILAIPLGSASSLYNHDNWLPPTRTCQSNRLFSDLAKQPTGIVAAEINMGPYVAINTAHRVVAAPYHRMDQSIIAGYWLLHATPQRAEKLIRKHQVSYVVVCQRDDQGIADNFAPGTLMHQLQTGAGVPFLEPIRTSQSESHLKLWRVKPAS